MRVRFGGRTEAYQEHDRRRHLRWVETHDVLAVPYDIPVPGYKNGTVNTLRLWKSAATDEFDLDEFNAGDYAESVAAKNVAENIIRWCFIPTMPARTARNCGCANNISWRRPACRT